MSNNLEPKELSELINDIKKMEDSDWDIIGNIIMKNEGCDAPVVTETSRGTYFNFKYISINTIKLIKYYIDIKVQNDEITKMKKNGGKFLS